MNLDHQNSQDYENETHNAHADETSNDGASNDGASKDKIDNAGEQVGNQANDGAKCLAELSMWQDQCKRISAEFENFKRRVDRDKITWTNVAKESILLELLSFVDTFEIALQQKDGVDHAGIEMVYQALLKLLSKNDVVVMPQTKEFDPQFHEAVMQVESADHKSGEIVSVLSKGFMIKDKVLRPAKVSVAL